MDSHYSVLNNIVFGGRKNVSDESKRNHGSDPSLTADASDRFD